MRYWRDEGEVGTNEGVRMIVNDGRYIRFLGCGWSFLDAEEEEEVEEYEEEEGDDELLLLLFEDVSLVESP